MNHRSMLCLLLACASAQTADRILIVTRNAVYREDNIPQARLAVKNLFEQKGLLVDTTENAGMFTDTTLAKYKALVFLKTSGDILNPAQQTAFETWFKAGGGLVAIHSALDTEYDWPFYGKLIGGAWFASLGGDLKTKQTIVAEDTADASTVDLPRRWSRTDEIYNFKSNPRDSKDPKIHVLVTVDGSSYPKGTPGADHPMSWYDAYQGGRAWVTAMGHTTESYSDPLFLGHVWGGMLYALGRTPTALARPARSRRMPPAPPGFGPGNPGHTWGRGSPIATSLNRAAFRSRWRGIAA
jgi:type 1 glutamine amidotransferase